MLITGASKGIGKAIAENLIIEGRYDVYGTSRNPDRVNDKNENLTLIQLDVTDTKSIQACVEQVGNIDILINNAGQSQIGAAEDIPIAKYKELFAINFFGVVEITNMFLPSIRKKKEKSSILAPLLAPSIYPFIHLTQHLRVPYRVILIV